jgi:NAD(P) transhydrogenase subunit beta
VSLAELIDLGYVAAAVLFILGLKMMTRPATARRGNAVSAVGMLLAIVATLLLQGLSFPWIALGILIGSAIGVITAYRVKMTAMPEMVGLLNGFGGLASMLVGCAEYHRWAALGQAPDRPLFTAVTIFLTVLIGAVTFSGSMVAFLKLAEWIGGKPVRYHGQHLVNGAILALLAAAGISLAVAPTGPLAYPVMALAAAAALLLGVTSVIGIGGADMPVVISLLNSYSGLAACAAGFVILNNVLIVAGALVGASGIILTSTMCKAMNRSLANVLFSGFGAPAPASARYRGVANPISADDAYHILEAARSVLFVPGYGMAVAQAQHAVRELADLLQRHGAEVRYCIHPVAGRMPGHMNVLLAEASVPYEQLVEPQDVNPTMASTDVAVVIGANDVVNPAARLDPGSPLYGMPVVNVDEARTCIVLKRSLSTGFAGVDNPLFFAPNTRMLFGDAKTSVTALAAAFKEG